MLRDRKYMVTKQELNMTKQEFFSERDFSEDDVEIDREKKSVILKRSQTNPMDQIFVFFPNEPKVGMKTLLR